MKTIAVIRSDTICPLGVVGDALDEAGVAWRYIEAWAGESPPDIGEHDGTIVLGGAMNADETEKYPYLADVRSYLRQATEAERPVLGICLGAQLLTRAFDAPVHRKQAREIGFCKVETTSAGTTDPVVGAFGPASMVFQFHEDHCELPAGAELLASSDRVEAQAFRIAWSYGVQFHFEVTLAEITAWADDTGHEELREVWGTTRDALLAEAADHLAAQQTAGRQAATAFARLLATG